LITVGPATSLNLDADERTLKNVETRVKGDTLIIDVTKSHGWFSDQGHLKIVVTTPTLKSLESNGAGDIEITGLNGGEQSLELAGAHNVKAEGRLDKLTVELAGAGNVDYHKVITGVARVTVNGAGNVEVNTTESLRAEVNGVGAVRYLGNPAKVESELHGLGAITRRESNAHEGDAKTNNNITSKGTSKDDGKKTEETMLQVEK
jgi:Putative auto-transporter adhesin, head GIN domain